MEMNEAHLSVEELKLATKARTRRRDSVFKDHVEWIVPCLDAGASLPAIVAVLNEQFQVKVSRQSLHKWLALHFPDQLALIARKGTERVKKCSGTNESSSVAITSPPTAGTEGVAELSEVQTMASDEAKNPICTDPGKEERVRDMMGRIYQFMDIPPLNKEQE